MLITLYILVLFTICMYSKKIILFIAHAHIDIFNIKYEETERITIATRMYQLIFFLILYGCINYLIINSERLDFLGLMQYQFTSLLALSINDIVELILFIGLGLMLVGMSTFIKYKLYKCLYIDLMRNNHKNKILNKLKVFLSKWNESMNFTFKILWIGYLLISSIRLVFVL